MQIAQAGGAQWIAAVPIVCPAEAEFRRQGAGQSMVFALWFNCENACEISFF